MHFPNESAEYRAARESLLEAEAHLRGQIEAVAARRRELPPGGAVPDDYVFAGTHGDVRFSELFGDHDTLAIYNFMFPRTLDDDMPCWSCSSMLDSLDGAARHLAQHVALAVVAKAPLPRILEYAEHRGWRNLRLLSSADNRYNRDYHGEAEDGQQLPMLNVFTRRDGELRHFWASELFTAPRPAEQGPRHVDFLWPIWSVLDVTPAGRPPDWEPSREYD
jgi:predicted dithiol-disulfide oxidoreductase (DUF899 family)